MPSLPSYPNNAFYGSNLLLLSSSIKGSLFTSKSASLFCLQKLPLALQIPSISYRISFIKLSVLSREKEELISGEEASYCSYGRSGGYRRAYGHSHRHAGGSYCSSGRSGGYSGHSGGSYCSCGRSGGYRRAYRHLGRRRAYGFISKKL